MSAGPPIGMPSGRPWSSGSSSGSTALSSRGRVFQHLLPEPPTPERCVEAYYLQRTRFESIAGQKLCRRRLTEGRNVEVSGRDFALARLLTRMFSDRAWLEAMGLRLDNLAEADGARSHRRCQINFYSRGRRTPCARRVLGSKVWGSY